MILVTVTNQRPEFEDHVPDMTLVEITKSQAQELLEMKKMSLPIFEKFKASEVRFTDHGLACFFQSYKIDEFEEVRDRQTPGNFAATLFHGDSEGLMVVHEEDESILRPVHGDGQDIDALFCSVAYQDIILNEVGIGFEADCEEAECIVSSTTLIPWSLVEHIASN